MRDSDLCNYYIGIFLNTKTRSSNIFGYMKEVD